MKYENMIARLTPEKLAALPLARVTSTYFDGACGCCTVAAGRIVKRYKDGGALLATQTPTGIILRRSYGKIHTEPCPHCCDHPGWTPCNEYCDGRGERAKLGLPAVPVAENRTEAYLKRRRAEINARHDAQTDRGVIHMGAPGGAR